MNSLRDELQRAANGSVVVDYVLATEKLDSDIKKSNETIAYLKRLLFVANFLRDSLIDKKVSVLKDMLKQLLINRMTETMSSI